MALDLDHLHPEFRRRVLATGHAVNSGARATCCGPSSQQYLFDHRNEPGFNPANPPGSSWHEYGTGLTGGEWALAVDFAGPPYPHGAPGFCWPIKGEPWHAQPAEVTTSKRVAGAEKRLPAVSVSPPSPSADPWTDVFVPVLT